MPAAYPCNKEFFEGTKGAYGLSVKNILSNGPFTINYIADDGTYITLIRVIEAKNGIDRIRISHLTEDKNLYDMYKADEISGFMSYDQTASKAEGTTYTFENSGVYLTFNPNNETLQNRDIRAAFAYYCYMLENTDVNKDAVKVNGSLFTPSLTYNSQKLTDAAKASVPSYMNAENGKSLLSQGLGQLGKTKIDTLKVLVPSDSEYAVIFEHINQLWQKELGVYLSVEFMPSADINRAVASGEYDMAFITVTPNANNPMIFLTPFEEYSAEIKDLIQKANSSNSSGYLSNISRAQNIVLEQAYMVPMCCGTTSYCHKSYFKNVDVNIFVSIVNLKKATVE